MKSKKNAGTKSPINQTISFWIKDGISIILNSIYNQTCNRTAWHHIICTLDRGFRLIRRWNS